MTLTGNTMNCQLHSPPVSVDWYDASTPSRGVFIIQRPPLVESTSTSQPITCHLLGYSQQ